MAIRKTYDKNGNLTEVVNDMEHFLTYRITDKVDEPKQHIIKHKPLLNKEIDSNFGAIKQDLESRAPIHNPTFTGMGEFLSTSALLLPVGNTAQRPIANDFSIYEGVGGNPLQTPGYIRYNNELHQFEGYEADLINRTYDEDGNVIAESFTYSWNSLDGDPTGGGTDKIFHLSERVMHYDYTIPEGHNAMVAGDLTMLEGVSLTIQSGTKLTIV